MDILKDKNFSFLFLGRIVTNIGDSLYYVATMWLVYELSQSSFYVGLAGFLVLAPKALQFLTGPFVDKWDIKKILVSTQLLQCLFLILIPVAYALQFLTVPFLLVLMPCIAIIEEFAYPTQTKALPLILKKTDLIKGNSLFSFAYQGVDLVFNALAGILVALIGAISLFIVDSITFGIAAILFSFLKIPKKREAQLAAGVREEAPFVSYKRDLSEGFSIVFGSLLWVFLLGSVVANFAIGITMAILPSFANNIGGVEMYGFLLTAVSAGSLIGALLGSVLGKFRVGVISIVCFALGAGSWTLSALIGAPIISTVLFGLAWIPIGAVNVLFAGIDQAVIPNQVLGRVNSVMYSISVIAMPIGSLLGGYLATTMSSSTIFAFTGIGVFFISLVWLVHPDLRTLPKAHNIDASTFKINTQSFEHDTGKEAPFR
ncbi:MFS transporter [Anaerobacillus sp. 1_MG-2023]|uniref:MFS transporter n=1 Tax=Anaerobacillus sp. 1_MG-2023 TaxID=3062655 RepID=UPI0026E424FA|nr:MFS transporter [Anaerobacillus sp. 1_MG-2023]MDO6657864.1 MFS transporter [Anaerobacillus sp. 1_MG-2023]